MTRPEEAYAALAAHLAETEALSQVAGLLSWDQEAAMPRKGAAQRGEQAAALAAVLHARRADPRIPDWAAAAAEAAPDPVAKANVAEALRAHARATRVPARLAADLARLTTRAHGVWAAARAERRYADFAPVLAEILALKRAEAACLRREGADIYDALLDDHEPGMTTAEAAALIGALRPRLVALRERIAGRDRTVPEPKGPFPQAAQLALARAAATVFGYDWEAGRLDLVVHPFCSGTGGDVRITTRTAEDTPFDCLYSTIHEVGHALYEQGLDPATRATPAGGHASIGVHESQSRLCENQIGRGLPFLGWFWAEFEAAFPGALPGPEALWRAANRVEPGFIRTEADEVHYNLHILMRFDLERALVAGDLDTDGLEAAWNDRFEADFGVRPPHAGVGVLQDVHWSAGLFGYFPTYALGNIYAGELFAAMRRDLPGLEDEIGVGNLCEVLGWLRAKVHRRGRLVPPQAIVAEAAGHAPTPGPLLDYLEAKFGALYDL